MFELSKYSTKIKIDLDNGLYVFENQSATGKSRLCSVLKKYCAYGEPIFGYTYSDLLMGIDISFALNPGRFKVIMLDRYDMYKGLGSDLILQCKSNSIILVDCKSSFTVTNDHDWCYIDMDAHSIEVS